METLNYDNFKGLDTVHTEARIDDNRQSILRNLDLTEQGYLKKRTGVRRLGEIADGGALRIMGRYKTSSVDRVIVYNAADEDLDYTTIAGAALTEISSTAGSDLEWMAQYAGVAYLTYSASAGRSYDGSTLTTLTSKVSGTMNLFFKDREWIINTEASSSDTLRYSNIAGSGGTDFSAANHPSGNSILVGRNDGQWITSIIVYNDVLYIFKNNSIWALYMDTNTPADWLLRSIEPSLGCIARATPVVHENFLYFEAQDGVYRTDGTVFQEISAPIRDIFINRPVTKNTTYEDVAVIHEDKYILQINNLDGNNTRKTLVYNIKVGGWSEYDWAHEDISPNSFLVVPDNSPESLFFGSLSPLPIPADELIYENDFSTNIASGFANPPFDAPEMFTGTTPTVNPFVNQSLGYGRFQTSQDSTSGKHWARIEMQDILPADVQIFFDWRISPVGTPGGERMICFRCDGAWDEGATIFEHTQPLNGYSFRHFMSNDTSTQQIAIAEHNAGVLSNLSSVETFAFSSSETLAHVIIRLEGSDMKVKIWLFDDPEPGSWTFEVSDATFATQTRFMLGLSAGTTNGGAAMQIDNLQFFTIAEEPAAAGYLFKFGAEVFTDEADAEYNYDTQVRTKLIDFGEPSTWKRMVQAVADISHEGPSGVGWVREDSDSETVGVSTNLSASLNGADTSRSARPMKPAGWFKSVGWEHVSLDNEPLYLYAISVQVDEKRTLGKSIG